MVVPFISCFMKCTVYSIRTSPRPACSDSGRTSVTHAGKRGKVFTNSKSTINSDGHCIGKSGSKEHTRRNSNRIRKWQWSGIYICRKPLI